MLSKTEQIQKYRRLISSRYLILGCAAALTIVTGVFTYINFSGLFLVKVMGVQMAWFGLAFVWYLFNHRQNLLRLLGSGEDLNIDPIAQYIITRKQRWDSLYPFKLVVGSVIALGFALSLFYTDGETIAQVLAGLFLIYLLAMIAKAWLNFNDLILLQDIRHSLRDHSS